MSTTILPSSDAVRERMAQMREEQEKVRIASENAKEAARIAKEKKDEDDRVAQEKAELEMRVACEDAGIASEARTLLEIESYDSNIKQQVINFLKKIRPVPTDRRGNRIYVDCVDCSTFSCSSTGVLYILDGFTDYSIESANRLYDKLQREGNRVFKASLIRRYDTLINYIKSVKFEFETEIKAEAEKKRLEFEEWIIKENKTILDSLHGHRHNFHGIEDHGYLGGGAKQIYVIEEKDTGKWRIICKQWRTEGLWADFPIFHNNPQFKIPIPELWKDDYETGSVPFMTVCPVCSKMNNIRMEIIGQNSHMTSGCVGTVYCIHDHYKWSGIDQGRNKEFRKGKHYRPTQHGNWSEYDPADPDGSKVRRITAEKEIADLEKILSEKRALLSLMH